MLDNINNKVEGERSVALRSAYPTCTTSWRKHATWEGTLTRGSAHNEKITHRFFRRRRLRRVLYHWLPQQL